MKMKVKVKVRVGRVKVLVVRMIANGTPYCSIEIRRLASNILIKAFDSWA